MTPSLATSVIKKFLLLNTHTDLASMYTSELECQVNVARDGGKRVENDFKGKQWHGWSDGTQTWKSFRIPYNANSEPEYTDRPITFDFDAHVEGIGMTGWNWVKRESRWVAFDFDAVAGHSSKHTKVAGDLSKVVEAASAIPWVTVRKSTSGKGLHLYVQVVPVETRNHTEHAALARAILAKMSAMTGFDFDSRVDICGGNMWVYHRKMLGTDGLSLIKQGTILTDIPPNWQEHIEIIGGKRKRIKAGFYGEDETSFQELVGQTASHSLDAEHVKLINYLQSSGRSWWWDNDLNMLVTHTSTLSAAHRDLGLVGIFRTNSTGDDPSDHNCFLFPLRNGQWSVRRYGKGTEEDGSWTQDGQGWTRTYLNRNLDLATACLCFKGSEATDGSFIFNDIQDAQEAAKLIGVKLELPAEMSPSYVKLKTHKDGRLLVSFEGVLPRTKYEVPQGWNQRKRNGPWEKLFYTSAENTSKAEVLTNYDDVIRHLVTEHGEDSGWVIKSENKWFNEPMAHMKAVLDSFDLPPKEVKAIIGNNVLNHWTLVNKPFAPEYPGGRKWNRNAAQLRYLPNFDSETLVFPTWLKILNHTGKGLDAAIAENKWCQDNGILTGADYLKIWIASLFQKPTQPLPYLFLYGPQGSGKTILHEAIKLLVTRGVVTADQALKSEGGFNGEIENAILCVIEETSLHKHKDAYDRIKAWVTGLTLPIHVKRLTPYDVVNTSHWIQCANAADNGPKFQGDTRITMLFVDKLPEGEEIAKRDLIPMLEKEAPDFLAEILRLEIPVSPDRLNVPVIETEDKKYMEESNLNDLDRFIRDNVKVVDGHMILFSDFYDEFIKFLEPMERNSWSKIAVGKRLPPQLTRGKTNIGNHLHIINASFNKDAEPKGKMFVHNERIQQYYGDGRIFTPVPNKPNPGLVNQGGVNGEVRRDQ